TGKPNRARILASLRRFFSKVTITQIAHAWTWFQRFFARWPYYSVGRGRACPASAQSACSASCTSRTAEHARIRLYACFAAAETPAGVRRAAASHAHKKVAPFLGPRSERGERQEVRNSCRGCCLR